MQGFEMQRAMPLDCSIDPGMTPVSQGLMGCSMDLAAQPTPNVLPKIMLGTTFSSELRLSTP